MTTLLRFAVDFFPWALSFPIGKIIAYGLMALVVCFGGYIYFAGQSARTEVEVLRRVNDTAIREKEATAIRIQTDGRVASKTHNAKVKELTKWAVKD